MPATMKILELSLRMWTSSMKDKKKKMRMATKVSSQRISNQMRRKARKRSLKMLTFWTKSTTDMQKQLSGSTMNGSRICSARSTCDARSFRR